MHKTPILKLELRLQLYDRKWIKGIYVVLVAIYFIDHTLVLNVLDIIATNPINADMAVS